MVTLSTPGRKKVEAVLSEGADPGVMYNRFRGASDNAPLPAGTDPRATQLRNAAWLEKNLGAEGLTEFDRKGTYYVPGVKQASDTKDLRTLEKRMLVPQGTLKGDAPRVGASGVRAIDVATQTPENIDRLVANAALTSAASEARTYAKMLKGVDKVFADPANAQIPVGRIARGFMPAATGVDTALRIGMDQSDLDAVAAYARRRALQEQKQRAAKWNQRAAKWNQREERIVALNRQLSPPESPATEAIYGRIQTTDGDNVDPLSAANMFYPHRVKPLLFN